MLSDTPSNPRQKVCLSMRICQVFLDWFTSGMCIWQVILDRVYGWACLFCKQSKTNCMFELCIWQVITSIDRVYAYPRLSVCLSLHFSDK